MKGKKLRKISLGFFLLFAFLFSVTRGEEINAETTDNWIRYQNAETNNGVTGNPAPTDASHAVPLWNVSPGSSATTPPLIVGDKIYTACGYYVYCYDKTTGEKLGQSDKLSGYVGEALHPMVYAENKLFVITNKGGSMIEALSLADPCNPKVQWASSPKSGTSYTPLTYHYNTGENKGYLYTGTFNGDDAGYYFCVSASDGKTKWEKKDDNGFYWDGAYATDNYVAFASENAEGANSQADGSALYTVDSDGKVIDSIADLKGSIRNTVVYDSGYLYVGTNAGRFYRIKVDEDGNLGKYSGSNDENFSYIDLGGRIKATALIHNGRAYVGVEGTTTGSSCFKVLDISKAFGTYSVIGTVAVGDEPKGAPILSTAEDGISYIYFTCNQSNGGIYYFTDSETDGLSSSYLLYEPETTQQEKCISSFALDSTGTIYYTNDSHYLMAVAPKLIKDVTVTSSGSTMGISWDDQRFEAGVRKYNLTVSNSVDKLSFNAQKVDGENADVSWKFIVNGTEQGSSDVAVNGENTTVKLQVTRKAITLDYYFYIYKVTSDNTALSLLYYGQNYYSGGNLLPAIEQGKTEYSTDLRNTSVSNPYLWVLPMHSGADVEVYSVENVKGISNGKALDYEFIEQSNGSYKYDVSPADSTKNTVIRIEIKSYDGTKTQNYKVKFIREDGQQTVTPPATTQTKPATTQTKPATTATTAKKKATTTVKITKPKKVTGFKAKKKKNVVTLKWTKVKGATGYQITVAKDKKFKKYKKNIYIKKSSICTKKIKLTKKIKYVRVRAYVKKSGKTVYGTYSKTLKIN